MSDDQKPIFRADSWDFPGGKHTQIIRSDSDGFVESQLLGDDLLLEAAMLAEPRRHRLAASSGAVGPQDMACDSACPEQPGDTPSRNAHNSGHTNSNNSTGTCLAVKAERLQTGVTHLARYDIVAASHGPGPGPAQYSTLFADAPLTTDLLGSSHDGAEFSPLRNSSSANRQMVEALFGNLEHPKSPHSEGSESPDTPLKVTGRHTGTVFAESPRQQLSWSVPNESQAAGRPPVSPFQAQQVAGFAPLMFQQQQQQQQAMLHYQAQQQPMPSAHQYERLLMQQRAQQAQLQAEAANLLIPAKAMSMPLRTVGNRRGFGSFSTIEATETQQVHETAVRRVQSFTPGLKSRKPTPTPPSTGNVSDEEGSGTASSDEEEDLQDGSTIKRRKTGKGSGKRGGRKPRRMTCRNCATHQTPQWRCGPEGPRTLCNACGVRFKKGLPLGPGTPGYVARSASTELMVE